MLNKETKLKKKNTKKQLLPSKYFLSAIVCLICLICLMIFYLSQKDCEDVPEHVSYPNAVLITQDEDIPQRASRLHSAYYIYETSNSKQEVKRFYENNSFACRVPQNNSNRIICESPNLESWYEYSVVIDDTESTTALAIEIYWYVDCQGYIYPW